MFEDYNAKFYEKLATRSFFLSDNNFAKAREIAAWKENVAANWDSIEVISTSFDDEALKHFEIGSKMKASIVIDKHGVIGNLGVEIVRLMNDPITGRESVKVYPMTAEKTEGSKVTYTIELKASEAGHLKFGVRIYPENKDLPHRMDFAYVKWVTF
jgi:starch phosphorylase